MVSIHSLSRSPVRPPPFFAQLCTTQLTSLSRSQSYRICSSQPRFATLDHRYRNPNRQIRRSLQRRSRITLDYQSSFYSTTDPSNSRRRGARNRTNTVERGSTSTRTGRSCTTRTDGGSSQAQSRTDTFALFPLGLSRSRRYTHRSFAIPPSFPSLPSQTLGFRHTRTFLHFT